MLPALVLAAATAEASKVQGINHLSFTSRNPRLFEAAAVVNGSKQPSEPGTHSNRSVRDAVAFIGQGTMTVSPSDVSAGDPVPLVFTYTADNQGIKNGSVGVVVPAGFPAPLSVPDDDITASPGYTNGHGITTTDAREFFASGLTLGPGQTLTLTYNYGASDETSLPPVSSGAYTFVAIEASSDSLPLAPLV